ncbi:III-FBPL precursor [Labeo rohita]|uniref:III-FBPL n=1 Tax=Labeo rohita TaxID=84645 RepID=A0A498M400_LABRO|nr:III-FBPL precursor [Labeo rohita]
MISGVVVYTENLALGGIAVQSSRYDALTAAQNANDGNRESIYAHGSCSHTKYDRNPWWRVDLLDVYRITRVSITNRGDCCEERIEGIQIRIGNSLENNGNNNKLAATVGPIPLGGTHTFAFKPIEGRYVNLFIPGRSEYLTLCEVEVFAEMDKPLYICVPRNIALGGIAAQSSRYDALTAAQNAIDGNRESFYKHGSCSHTKQDRNPWWRVDLLDVYRITRVSITNRGDCCEERIEGTQIRIGNGLENNGNNNMLAATVGPIPPGGTHTFAFKPIEGRYVNLFIPGRSEYLTLCEVEVYAENVE